MFSKLENDNLNYTVTKRSEHRNTIQSKLKRDKQNTLSIWIFWKLHMLNIPIKCSYPIFPPLTFD